MSRSDFTTIRTEGALLPPGLLKRLREPKNGLPGSDEAAYHVAPPRRLTEVISEAWNTLQGTWTAYCDACDRLPDSDTGTTLTRERWLQPLFQTLGYGRLLTRTAETIDGVSYPISHGWHHVPIHLVSHRVDLDRRTAGVAGAARTSPHGLLQGYLNATDNSLWGIVSNGHRLRLLRDHHALTRQSYVEYDLEAMFDGEVYSDFVLLYLTIHQSRLEADKPTDTLLEQWATLAREQGTRALDRLRDGVERALKALGQGFLDHPANTTLKQRLRDGDLDPHVYRLLVLFAAEDRDLLHPPATSDYAKRRYAHYGTRHLRDVADKVRGGPHPDRYEVFKRLTHWLGQDGAPDLGLPALGGFLFGTDATPDLDTAQLANRMFLRTVRALAFTDTDGARLPVDYRNLGAEELGSVYESLLELRPTFERDRFDLIAVAGSERKTTGSFYTPTSLITILLDGALDPVLDEAAQASDPERAILDLKIVDPASGSGHFLIAAAHRIARRLAQVRTGHEEPFIDATRTALRDVIGHCVYAVDLNPMAVELCKVALWLEALDPGKPFTFLDHHIKSGNSLLGLHPRTELVSIANSGVPDAAYESVDNADREACARARERNRRERAGEQPLFAISGGDSASPIIHAFRELGQADDTEINAARAKEDAYKDLVSGTAFRRLLRTANTWCAAFVSKKSISSHAPFTTADVHAASRGEGMGRQREALIDELADRHGFFHWSIEFPDVFANRGGFDVVLGNPPYGALASKRDRVLSTYLFPTAAPTKNLAADFIELGEAISRSSGRIGYVVPKSLTYSATWRPIRRWLRDRLTMAVDVGKAWKVVLLEQVTIAYRNSPTAGNRPLVGRLENATPTFPAAAGSAAGELETIPTGLTDSDLVLFSETSDQMRRTLSSICRTRRGAPLQRHMLSEGDIPVLGGRSIAPFRAPAPTGFLSSANLPDRAQITRPPQLAFQNIVSHVSTPISHIKLIGTVLEEPYACLDTVNLIEISDSATTPYALGAYLMSDFINWYVFVCLFNRAIRTMHFDNYILGRIPAPPPSIGNELDRLGRALIGNPASEELWDALDGLVDDAFGAPLAQRKAYRRRTEATH